MNHIIRKQHENYYWQFDAHVFPDIEHAHFTPLYWQQADKVLGKESGRGTTWFVKHQNHELVLRHYLRGGLVSKLNRDRYFFKRWQSCRCISEFDILLQLRNEGFPVPRPIAAQVIRHNLRYRADIIIERIAGAQDLLHILKAPQNDAFYQQLAESISRFHLRGLFHADLNIQNILFDQEQFWLIDFDRAKLLPPQTNWQNKTLKRLKRSFEKEKTRHGIHFTQDNWQVFLQHYLLTMKNAPHS